jgi:SAM-dependent methyltransferase
MPVDMTHSGPDCPSCGTPSGIRITYPSRRRKWRDLSVHVCDACGFGWVPTIPFDLDAYYAKEYGKIHGRKKLRPSFFATIDQSDDKKVKRARWHARLLKDRFGRLGRVLDIGAGPGFFLHYVDAAEKFAIESDRHSQAMLTALGVTVLEQFDQAPPMDAIVASHVLEHIPVSEYKAFARSAVDALAPGGVLLIEVPSSPHLDRNAMAVAGKDHDPHTLFFSLRALLRTVEGARLVLVQDNRFLYPALRGRPDRANPTAKPEPASKMLGVWRKPRRRGRGTT